MSNLHQKLSSYLNLTGNEQGWHPILCPLHDDRNPSATINWSIGYFLCRAGCGNFTLAQLAIELGLEETEEMTTSEETLAYLRESASLDSADKFHKEAVHHLKNFMDSRKIAPEIYSALGAYPDLVPNSPTFGYIVFPFAGNHYVARKFIPGMVGEKYLNSKGSKQFYGLEHLDEEDKDVILVEGIYDYLALFQLGFKNVVAALSTNFHESAAYELRGRTVFILFDNDYAGFKGTIKAIELLSSVKANPIPLDIREFNDVGNDPDEVAKTSPKELKEWMTLHTSQYDAADARYVREVFLMNRDALRYFSTGMPTFDRILGGGLKEGFHVIAGEPGVGKSALSIWLSVQIALRKVKILYCTYEISKRQCWSRVGSQFDNHTWSQIEMNPEVINQVTKESLTVLSESMRIVAGWSANEIERAAPNYDLIIVDYIQRMPGPSSDVRTNVSHNCQRLSNLARDNHKIILCVSSLSRSGYKPEAGMAALKESGDIEYVAQSITRLFGGGGRIIIADVLKNTRGPVGKFWIEANLGACRFMETTPTQEADKTPKKESEYGI